MPSSDATNRDIDLLVSHMFCLDRMHPGRQSSVGLSGGISICLASESHYTDLKILSVVNIFLG